MIFNYRTLLLSGIAGLFALPSLGAEGPEIKVGAHAFLDYESITVAGTEDVSGTNLRLFRVDLNGSYKDYKFQSNFDLQNNDIKIQDLFAEFGTDLKVRIGNYKVMNGLEQSSSLYATNFMEAASVTKENGLARSLGIGIFKTIDNVTLSAGVFGPNANDVSDSDIYSVSARATWSAEPFGEDSLLHLGSSLRFRDSNDTGMSFGYSQRAFGSSAPTTVKTPRIADTDLFVGLESVLMYKGWSFQSEFGQTQVDCNALCSDDPHMNAYYIDAGYMWGGRRTYKDGLFKRTKVNAPASDGGHGAFALTGRYDVADLSDGSVIGGKQETYVLGATWYRDKYVRLMVNASHCEFDNSPAYGNEDADTILVRAQIELY